MKIIFKTKMSNKYKQIIKEEDLDFSNIEKVIKLFLHLLFILIIHSINFFSEHFQYFNRNKSANG